MEAMFGVSPYGGSLHANVYYTKDNMCGLRDVDKSSVYPTNDGLWESPFILLVDSHDCGYVQIVRNGQHAGAAAVLVADKWCLCGVKNCANEGEIVENSRCETTMPIMGDDGSGGDVSIPSFLLQKQDADKMKDVLKQNRTIQMEVSWDLPHPDGRVEYELLTAPNDIISRSFMLNWKTVAEALGDRAYFTPIMFISNSASGEFSYRHANPDSCTNRLRYCYNNHVEFGVSGTEVVRESLRRLCIWDAFGASNGIGTQWWDYVKEHDEKCASTPGLFSSEKCIDEIYKKVGIDSSRIERCIIDSGSPSEDVSNTKLENTMSARTDRGAVVVPSVFINSAQVQGALNVKNVLTAICYGFAEGTAPEVCKKCSWCGDVVSCIENDMQCKDTALAMSSHSSMGRKHGVISFGAFLMSMMLLIVMLGVATLVFRKRSRNEMKSQVGDILAEYMPLHDDQAVRRSFSVNAFNLNFHSIHEKSLEVS